MNWVELLNGCIVIGYLNFFILLIIFGLNFGVDGGIDKEKLKVNFNVVIDVYLNFVFGMKCVGNFIFFVKGVDNDVFKVYLERRNYLLIFL